MAYGIGSALPHRLPWWLEELMGVIVALAQVITNGGKAVIVDRMRGLNTTPSFVGWGTGAGVAAATDTDLFTPASEARVNGTVTAVTTAVAGDTLQVVATLIADGPKTITNVGQFTALTGGTCYSHADHSGVTLALSEGIQYTLKTQYS